MAKTNTIKNCFEQKLNSKENQYLVKDKELILAHVLNKSRAFILAHSDYKLSKNEQNSFNRLIHRRLKGEPLAYVLGEQEFYGLPFKVNKHVLIPRPETEQIVEQITNNKQQTTNSIIIDVGTGSGAIIVSIARNLKNKNAKFFAIDISSKALVVAKQNAKLNKVDKQIAFLKGNLLKPFLANLKIKDYLQNYKIKNSKIIITANLPYLKTSLLGLTKSQKHDLSFEPRLALVAGADGLKYYRLLCKQIQKIKKLYPEIDIELLTEIDPDQVKPMKQIFSFAKNIKVKKDFRKLDRLCIIDI